MLGKFYLIFNNYSYITVDANGNLYNASEKEIDNFFNDIKYTFYNDRGAHFGKYYQYDTTNVNLTSNCYKNFSEYLKIHDLNPENIKFKHDYEIFSRANKFEMKELCITNGLATYKIYNYFGEFYRIHPKSIKIEDLNEMNIKMLDTIYGETYCKEKLTQEKFYPLSNEIKNYFKILEN